MAKLHRFSLLLGLVLSACGSKDSRPLTLDALLESEFEPVNVPASIDLNGEMPDIDLPDDLEITETPVPGWNRLHTADHYQGTREQARGTYAGGTLINADELPDSGPGFLKLYLPRDRAYGAWDLVQILQDTAIAMAERFTDGERLQIGDMNAKSGGALSGHGSHTNGLDVDLAYFRMNRWEQDPTHTSGFEEDFVKDGKVTANFDRERNWALVRAFYLSNRLNRIFVGEAIKRDLCRYAKALPTVGANETRIRTETLRRLRPWAHHDDHLHVRITCPKNSPKCVPQAAPPAGDGCADVGA